MSRPTPPPTPADLSPTEIAARVAWGRRAGHPQYVWPEVPVAGWRASLAAIQAAVIDVLAGRTATLNDPAGAKAMGIAGFTSGMGPLLGWWIERGQVVADAACAATLAEHLEHGRRRWSNMQLELARVVTALSPLEVIVLKGAHTALTCFPDPGTRPAIDIDLLIADHDADAAQRALTTAGYTPAKTASSVHRSEWNPPGRTSALRSIDLMHADNPLAIELHTSLGREFHGIRRVRLDEGATVPFPGGAIPARVLTQPALFAFLALHASEELHRVRLIQIVELVLMARSGGVPWSGMVAALERAHGAGLAWPALAVAERLSPGAIPADTLASLARHTPASLRGLVAQSADRLIEGAAFDAPFAWTSGPWETLKRAAFMVWPRERGRSVGDVVEIYRRRLRRALHRR